MLGKQASYLLPGLLVKVQRIGQKRPFSIVYSLLIARSSIVFLGSSWFFDPVELSTDSSLLLLVLLLLVLLTTCICFHFHPNIKVECFHFHPNSGPGMFPLSPWKTAPDHRRLWKLRDAWQLIGRPRHPWRIPRPSQGHQGRYLSRKGTCASGVGGYSVPTGKFQFTLQGQAME